jgi:hypothetical protein
MLTQGSHLQARGSMYWIYILNLAAKTCGSRPSVRPGEWLRGMMALQSMVGDGADVTGAQAGAGRPGQGWRSERRPWEEGAGLARVCAGSTDAAQVLHRGCRHSARVSVQVLA